MIINGNVPGDPVEVAKAMKKLKPAAETAGTGADNNDEIKKSKSSEEKKPAAKRAGRKSTKKTEQPAELFEEESK